MGKEQIDATGEQNCFNNQLPNEKCDCTKINRRDFMVLTAAGAAGAALNSTLLPVMAGPFEENEYLNTIPVDKKLDPKWVASLTARGEPTVVTDPAALQHIGMPIGGLFSGNLYLGGDGKLWLWDIFNRVVEGILPRQVQYKGQSVGTSGGANYVSPAPQESPIDQGFAVSIDGKVRPLDNSGFADISFEGRYPIGRVTYRDKGCSVSVKLEAYSPFIPLNTDDSSLPATVMSYTVRNESSKTVNAEISGWLENAICLYHRDQVSGTCQNRVLREKGMTFLSCSAEPVKEKDADIRPDILFEDFEKDDYEGWTVTGTALGDSPIKMADMPDYQGDVAGEGKRVVNTHNVRQGEDVRGGDQHVGTLTSKPFVIQRKYINFLIGGGAHEGKTCMNLLIDGKVVKSATGRNNNRMNPGSFTVTQWEGKHAQIQIVDKETGGWGNIGVDHIVFSDKPAKTLVLNELHDFGTMGLALLSVRSPKDDGSSEDLASAYVSEAGQFQQRVDMTSKPLSDKLVGSVGRRMSLMPGQEQTVTFVVTWHFPNLSVAGMNNVGRHYASRFSNAQAVAQYVAENFERLSTSTRLWCDTWYDSSLPYWFLDRTMANTTTLATSTCYRFKDGRFWAWEGIGCCHGTCTHVWHYAQAVGRLFPEIERNHREQVDFGVAFHADGGIGHRANLQQSSEPAHDGQCGRILGVYREHQMTADSAFLKRIWPKVKKAIEYMIQNDRNDDGIVEGSQPNTLDAAWFGKISFLVSLYLAALRAGEVMAIEIGDNDFVQRCRDIAERGRSNILKLYNGEYFYQIEDPKHLNEIGIGKGCYIDQVFGQSWAFQVGLGRLFDEQKIKSALRALWKYNFVPDVGPFREKFKRGRWYAMAGDAGLLMCTWPKGGLREDFKKHWQYMYFNECMTGFEWQVASHMIWEGMITEGLAVARAIHDRYNAALRNPYNEIECSDHYARAMASYGAFITACGYEYHGPKGYLAFAPKINPKNFKAAFTTAQGWGSFSQKISQQSQTQRIELKHGSLRLSEMEFELGTEIRPGDVAAEMDGQAVRIQWRIDGRKLCILFQNPVILAKGDNLSIKTSMEGQQKL
jgi:non-lysosomal glucosylceramidase